MMNGMLWCRYAAQWHAAKRCYAGIRARGRMGLAGDSSGCSVLIKKFGSEPRMAGKRTVCSAAESSGGSNRKDRIPVAPSGPRRMSLAKLRNMAESGKPLVMLTAYDYPSAVHADLAGIDIVLVGDSLGMVELGHDTTQFVTMSDMLHHCRAVVAGARRPLIVGDMPFGSYEVSEQIAVENALRMIKEGHVNAVKLEGGMPRAKAVRRIVETGIAVMGHTGLTPQSISSLGSFRPMGQTLGEAKRVLEDALALQEAGVFAIVLECVPARLAKRITEILDVPTIGIGAGRWTSGQVLVYHDMVGMLTHPHHAKVTPKFCKKYARTGEYINNALQAYRDEVRSRTFPSDEFSPYSMPDSHWDDFDEFSKHMVKSPALQQQTSAENAANADIKVY